MAEGVQNDLCPGRIRKQQRRPRGVQPWRIAACRGCHAVQEIGGVSKPWLLSLFQDFGGPEVSLKFGSLDFSWISLPIVHVESINDELIWSADFGSMLLHLCKVLPLIPLQASFTVEITSLFEPNHFTSTASVWRKETHPLLAMPLFAPRQQFWRVNKQTKGTPLQKQSERGLLGRPKRSAELALQVLRTQHMSWHWIIPKGFTLSSSWSLHCFTFWTEIGVHTHQRPEASQRAACCGGWWYSFWARMGFSRQSPSEWNIHFWAQRDEDGGRQALWSVGIHHLQYETNLFQPSPCPEHFITVGPSCLHQTETLKRAVNLSRAMWEMWVPQDAGAFGGLKMLERVLRENFRDLEASQLTLDFFERSGFQRWILKQKPSAAEIRIHIE